MKIALVHDWLTGIGGDVRVLKAIHELYPEAPIFCMIHDKSFTDIYFPNAIIVPSMSGKKSRLMLPLLPFITESMDLSEYDLVISTGSIFSKGIITRPRTIHINYCHSPTRQVWDLSSSYNHKLFQHILRIWDRNASTRIDKILTNSEHVRKRINKFYRRDAEVIYPPVNLGITGKKSSQKEDFFLIVSRLYKHKNIEIAVNACNKLELPLIVIGDGPEYRRLKALAGPTVRILGHMDDSTVNDYYERCRAFIMPQEEDFGIAPVEAMAHGKPVLALRRGGALEYVQEGINGLFFDSVHEAVLADGIRRILSINFNSKIIRSSAEKFSWKKFQSSFSNLIDQTVHSRA